MKSPPATASRDEPYTEAAMDVSESQASIHQGTTAYHLFRHQHRTLSRGHNLSTIFNEGNLTLDSSVVTENNFAIYNAPKSTLNITWHPNPQFASFIPLEPANSRLPSLPLLGTTNNHKGASEGIGSAPQFVYDGNGYQPSGLSAAEPTVTGHHCGNCNMPFPTRKELSSHSSRNKYICKGCACFRSKVEKDRHINNSHSTCKYCSQQFNSAAELKKHKDSESQLGCRFCPEMRFCFMEHGITHAQNTHAWCDIRITYCKPLNLDTHKEEYHVECEDCNPWEIETYSNHFYDRHGACDKCSGRCKSRPSLDQHMETHPKCSFCDERFEDLLHLDSHKEQYHPPCTWCPPGSENFVLHRELEIHMEKEHPECNECDKRCRTRKELSKHKDNRHPRCDLCPRSTRSFSSKQERDSHRQAEHPSCDICGITLRNRGELIQHENNSHPFCNLCHQSRRFVSHAELCDHNRSCHYPCDHCDNIYKHRDDLDIHQRTRQYVCEDCGRVYGYFDELNRHMRARHKCSLRY
jgi:hypothetical protein